MNLGAKKFDRYIMPAIISIDLIAAFGWANLIVFAADWVQQRVKQIPRLVLVWGSGLGLAALSLIPLLNTRPYYITYYNPLLGGIEKAQRVITLGWGEGLDQVAAYLNEDPDAYKQTALSFYGYGPFSYLYDGNGIAFLPGENWDAQNSDKLLYADYIVVYISQRQRQMHQPLMEVLDQLTPVEAFYIDSVKYAELYNVADISAEDYARLTALAIYK